jgi:predicted GNAT family acetyltransferase/glutaredoxin
MLNQPRNCASGSLSRTRTSIAICGSPLSLRVGSALVPNLALRKQRSPRPRRYGGRVGDGVVTLYQAEWCPFSSAVREVLTELGLDFVARQVEPWPEERSELRRLTGTAVIPVLQTENGRVYRGTREIFGHLRERDPWRFAAVHRQRFADHRDARESDAAGQLIEYFRGTDELEAATDFAEKPQAVDNPESSRYELRLGDRLIGLAAYRRRDGRIALTHTEVDESCEGRGYGSRLVAAALEDARRQGLAVVPLCPFVAHFVERHPEYQDLVAPPSAD